jgi:eukaryotic-like serine/threonine-protein kinase
VGQSDKAIDSELRCIRRDPQGFWPRVILGWAYQQKGRHEEAVAELQEAVKLTRGAPFTLAAYGQALAASGDRRGALDVLAQLDELAKTRYVSGYDIGLIYAGLDDRDAAFHWLETAREQRASFLPLITWDRRADRLRGDRRFATLLAELGLPAAR